MDVSVLMNAFHTVEDYGYRVIFLIAREVDLVDLVNQIRPIRGSLANTIMPREGDPVTDLVLFRVFTVISNSLPDGHFRLVSISNELPLSMTYLCMIGSNWPPTRIPPAPGQLWIREFESDPEFITDHGVLIPRRIPEALPPTRFERLVADDS